MEKATITDLKKKKTLSSVAILSGVSPEDPTSERRVHLVVQVDVVKRAVFVDPAIGSHRK